MADLLLIETRVCVWWDGYQPISVASCPDTTDLGVKKLVGQFSSWRQGDGQDGPFALAGPGSLARVARVAQVARVARRF